VYEFALTASGTVAALPPAFDFGPVGVGTNGLTFGFPISVQGCVQVASIKTTGDFQQTNNCGNAVSNGSCFIQVTFVPTNSGPRTGSVTVDFGSSSPGQTVALTGQGVGTSMFASPPSLQFGDQQLQTSSPAQSVIVAAFNPPALINAIWINGDFTQTNNCPPIPVVSPCSLNVVFTPTATGPRSGFLTVSSDHGILTVPLSGNGVGAGSGSISPTSLAFPDQPVNTTSGAQLVTITNTGGRSFLAGHFTISGDFSATPSAQCRVALNPGKSCTYAVTFIPQVPGIRTGTLTVLTDVGNLSVSLSGTGLAPVPSVAPQT